MFQAPQLIRPFEGASSFTTNLNSVEIVLKLSQGTVNLYLNDVNIIDDVTFVSASDFNVEVSKPSVPFLNEVYVKTYVDLSVNSLNILVFKSENASLIQDSLEIQVSNLSFNSIGVDIEAPLVLSTDYKNNSIILKWQDNNDIQVKPSGSGYRVYFTHEVENRSSSYTLLNSIPYADYNRTEVSQDIRSSTITSSDIEVLVPEPTVGSYQKSVAVSSGSQFYRYYIVDRNDISLSPTTVDQQSDAGQRTLYLDDTTQFEKKGARLVIDAGGVGEEVGYVESFSQGVSVTLTEDLTNTHSIGVSVSVSGDRERELLFSQVKSSALTDLITFNTYLTTFQHPDGAGVDLSVKSEASSYLTSINDNLSNSENLTTIEIDQYVVDAGLIVNKYTDLFPLYTYKKTDTDSNGTSDSNTLDYIDYCNIIIQTYPDLSSNYTYNVIKTTENKDGLYILLSDVVGTAPSFSVEYFTQSKVLIDSTTLNDYQGFYKSDTAFLEYPIYQYQNFVTQSVETETTVRDSDLLLSFEFTVNNANLPADKPLTLGQPTFFRISFLYVDTISKLIVESALSQEFFGVPLDISGNLVQLNSPTPVQLQTSMVSEIIQVNPNLDLKPGTVNRTAFINPMSTVLSNLHYREYFREVSQSFLSLLDFDDIDSNGASRAVNESDRKIALRDAYALEDTDENNTLIQSLIDNRFDLLADNYGVSRGVSSNSTGTITLYVNQLPTDGTTIIAFAGTLVYTEDPRIVFETLNTVTASQLTQVADYSGKYSVSVPIRSLEAGAVNNVPANTITQINSSGGFVLSVTNPAATFGGQDQLNNFELVERVKSKLISVDTGTLNGYTQKISETGLVTRSKVVASGDDLMRRDYDYVLGRTGRGAVDVYIQGAFPRSVSETIGVFYEETPNVLANYQYNNVGNAYSYNSPYTIIDLKANNVFLTEKKIGLFSITRAELINGSSAHPFTTPTNLVLSNYVKLGDFKIGLDLSLSELTVTQVNTVTVPEPNTIRLNFINSAVDYSAYLNKRVTTKGFSNLGNNVCERRITQAGQGFIVLDDPNSLGVAEGVSTSVTVDISGNLDLSTFGGDCIFAENVSEVSLPAVGRVRYSFDSSTTDYTQFIGSMLSSTGYSVPGNNIYGNLIVNAGVGFVDVENSLGLSSPEVVVDPTVTETRVYSTVFSAESGTLYFDLLFRKDFEHRWDNKPVSSITSVVDSNNVTYQPFLNYTLFNNSSLIAEGGSILEDSGIRILSSPIPTRKTLSVVSTDVTNDRIFSVSDMWYSSAPILENLDTGELFYVDQFFVLVRSSKYFFVRLNNNFPIPQGMVSLNLRIKYGPNYSIYKDLSFRLGVDTLVDELKYSYYTSIESSDLGELVESVHYDLIALDQNDVAVRFKTFGFDTQPNSTITVNYFNNINVGSADNINDPVSSGVDSNLSLVPNIPVVLSRFGIELSSVVVRPASPLGVLLEPFVLNVDYSLTIRPDTQVSISRISSGNIKDNTYLNVYYTYADELDISYIYNAQVGQLTSELENFAHAGSDFLVKSLAPSAVDIKAIVYLFDLSTKDTVDIGIRNGIISYVNQLDIGVGLYESDIVRIIDASTGVRNVKVKLSQLSLADSEVSYMEKIDRSFFTEYAQGNVTTYYSPSSITNGNGDSERLLKYVPQPNGGTLDKEKSIFVDNVKYELVNSPREVSEEKGLAHISSSGSLFISFIDETKKDSVIEVTYQVQSLKGSQDIEIQPFEYIQVRNLTLNFVQQ